MSLNIFFNKKRHVMFLVAPLFITACFGVEPSSIQNPVLILPPAAVSENLNTIIVINDQNTHTVSLKGLVTVEEGLELALDSVDPLSANCPPPSSLDSKKMTYTFSPPSGPKVCFYRYTLSTKGSDGRKTQSHALNYVRIISDITDSKPPLSFPHFNVKHIESSPFEINVVAELTKLNISTTGKILASDVIVLGSGSAIAMNESSILFTPSNTTSMSRLLYTMTSQDGLDVDAGSIDIFIAQNNTPLPSANNFVHSIPAIIGEEITVDVNEHISNTELRPLSLSSVTVFDASATLAKENDPACETCFNFKATKQGVFKVNYVINDQEQNYASAIVTINVNKPWKNITTGIYNKLFSAPLDETDAKNLAISISSFDFYPTISQLKIPRFTHAVAASFCISKGKRLPYKDELIDLFNLRAQSLYISDKWPVTTPYWIFTDTQEAVSLEDGALLNSVHEAFVTCTDRLVVDVIVSPLKTELRKKETFQFNATTVNEKQIQKNASVPIVWESSNPSIASVDNTGKITAHLVGKTTISASFRNITSLKPASVMVFELSDIKITPATLVSQYINQRVQLSAKGEYTNNLTPSVTSPITWRSDAVNVATVDTTGLVTTVAPGTARIYAIMENKESITPLIVTVIPEVIKMIGNTGITSAVIDTEMYSTLTFKGGNVIDGIHDITVSTHLAGGSGGATQINKMNLKTTKKIISYMTTENGVSAVAKLSWTDDTGQTYSAGQAATHLPIEKEIIIDNPIRKITAYWSGAVLGEGFITGLAFHL